MSESGDTKKNSVAFPAEDATTVPAACHDSAEDVVISPASPDLSTTASSDQVVSATSTVHDSVTVCFIARRGQHTGGLGNCSSDKCSSDPNATRVYNGPDVAISGTTTASVDSANLN